MSDTQQQPDLMHLALVARTRPGFIAGPLFAYQDSKHLTLEQLAFIVGIPVERLPHLALCEWPHSEEQMAAMTILAALIRPLCGHLYQTQALSDDAWIIHARNR